MKPFQAIFVLLFFISGCSTRLQYVAIGPEQTVEASREVASTGTGIPYPVGGSFRLADFKGSTYVTFVKNKVKPALDKLSDVRNGGGGGFNNIGSEAFRKNSLHLNPVSLSKYKGAKWDRSSRTYRGGLGDPQVEMVYDSLKVIKAKSTVDSLTYFNRDDNSWFTKNDMALALKKANVNAAPFDLATLYALTGGLGVKVKLDDQNYNYHVLYLTGKSNPHVEVMSGRSFASSVGRGVADATDPEYLRDLEKYLRGTNDQKPFYRALLLSLAANDTSEWHKLHPLGQAVLSDFLTVYTAECVRHLMVNLQDGNHPWEIDLAAVTFVSSVSVKLGAIVTDGKLVKGDIGGWFAPSPNNKEGKPRRSGIGITRRDRVKFQQAIHRFEMTTPDGRDLIRRIQSIIGTQNNKDDVIQGVFEFLSNPATPMTMGPKAVMLADLMAMFIEEAREDADQIVPHL